ncbi:MAG: hypothetical protein H0A76_00400 [Candidatus Thiodubiliella endoseptemdiera]|uniref:Uncharacterized protein n=1 Tax=Candidatus Thiodubiliella endoseptemdiera TaxID=2738886 RepID=A0A853EZ71_9GAMM|nr:hypothetical protein [Candidatus Thiodubiliella endoseptemdiera]
MGFVANIVNDAVDFVEEVADSAGYFITGNYEGDNGDNTITAVGVAVWGSGIKTYGGNDTVHAASLKLDVYDTWGI